MRMYADTSFLLRLLVRDDTSETAVAAHRSLGRPDFVFTSLHRLEITNAIRLRTFLAANGALAATRKELTRAEEAAFRRLAHALRAGALIPSALPWDEAVTSGLRLSEAHAKRIGLRSLDLLHVGACQAMKCRHFLTCDQRQSALAKAAGLKVTWCDP
jgi:predicted nucleic acid-binding protein